MVNLLAKLRSYNQRLKQPHGWEVELTCPRCGSTVIPNFLSWTPNFAIALGNTPTIYADIACRNCGFSLKTVAGEKLVELFAPVSVPRANKRAMIVFTVGVVLLVVVGLVLPAWRAWAWLSVIPLAAIRPLMLWFDYRVTTLRESCACGRSKYKFMGLLGRSMCYRCSNCGRLLRLRN